MLMQLHGLWSYCSSICISKSGIGVLKRICYISKSFHLSSLRVNSSIAPVKRTWSNVEYYCCLLLRPYMFRRLHTESHLRAPAFTFTGQL